MSSLKVVTRAGVAAIVITVSLVSCSKQEPVSTPEVEAPAHVVKSKGPHGSQDPHAALSANKLIQVALQHRDEGRLKEAIDVMNDVIVRHDKQASYYSIRGSLKLEMGQVSESLTDFEQPLAIQPNDPVVLTNRAQAYRQFGRIAEALSDLDKAIEKNPDFIAARFNRGAIYYSSSDFNKALKDFNHCIAVNPHTDALYFNRASVYDALGQRDNAIADIKRFMELSKNDKWKKTAKELLDKWQKDSKPEKS